MGVGTVPEYLEDLMRRSPILARAAGDGVDITLLIERLSWTPTERVRRLQQVLALFIEMRRAGQRKRGEI